jgi:hypothetical protein
LIAAEVIYAAGRQTDKNYSPDCPSHSACGESTTETTKGDNLPFMTVACTLTTAQLHERRLEIMNTFRSIQVVTSELEDGYAFTFQVSSEALQRIGELVDLERQCCPFLAFRIVVDAGNQGMRLEVTGPVEAKKMIAEYFTL